MSLFTLPYSPKQYINGAWAAAQSGKTFDVTNPATGKPVGSAPDSDVADTDAAIAAAAAAFPKWRALHAKDRTKIMLKWADLIEQHTEDLARLLTAEQGKPLAETYLFYTVSQGPNRVSTPTVKFFLSKI